MAHVSDTRVHRLIFVAVLASAVQIAPVAAQQTGTTTRPPIPPPGSMGSPFGNEWTRPPSVAGPQIERVDRGGNVIGGPAITSPPPVRQQPRGGVLNPN